FVVELSNNTLTNIKGQQAKNPDLTLTINRSDLETVMMGAATLDDQIKNGKAQLTGDRKPFDAVRGMLTEFRMDFQILPGTGGTSVVTAPPDEHPFEQESEAIQTITD